MKTIYSDGKTLEIERKLKITVFLPQLCYFCGEDIIRMRGKDTGSLIFHSLDENHNNWESSNKVPAHAGCHLRYHNKGDKSPMKRPEQRQRMREKNPMKDPETAKKILKHVAETILPVSVI